MPAVLPLNSLSKAAEDIFFAHSEFTAADWKRWLGRQGVGREIASQEVLNELGFLVSQLDDLLETIAPDVGGEAEASGVQSLQVSGRQGSCYELLDHLGSGGHSVVYRSLQCEPFERFVAIKVYYRSAHSLAAIGNLRELRAITRLQHPGVCQVLDAGITPWQQPFLALELIEGGPLHEHLAATSAPLEERLRLFAEILEAVTYTHSQGVVHRDLKPHNVLVHAASGRVKLIDFSISGISDPEAAPITSPTTAGYGTREYQSPEQAGLIQHAIDARSDIYSLGCVLFEMLTGERAFSRDPGDISHAAGSLEHDDAQAARLSERLTRQLSTQSPDVPATQRTALAAIVQRCVARQPADRFQTAPELQQHIDALRSGQPLPLVSRVQRPRRVHIDAAAVVLIVAAAAAAVPLSRLAQVPGLPPADPTATASTPPVGPAAIADSLLAMLAVETEDAWQARLTATLAELSPHDRLNVALRLAPLTIEQELFDACRMVTDAVAAEQVGPADDLRTRAVLAMYRVNPSVADTNAAAARAATEPLVEQLRQQGLLETTREGLGLLNHFANLLFRSFGAEGRARAAALLTPVLADPDRLIDISPSVAEELIITGMFLELLQDQPQQAIRLADVFEARLMAEAKPTNASRWAYHLFRAFLAQGQFEDACDAIGEVLTGPHRLAWGDGGKLLLVASTHLEKSRRLDDAVALLGRFELPLEPVDADEAHAAFHSRMERARLLIRLGRQAEALLPLQEATQIARQWPDALPADAAVCASARRGDAEAAVGNTSAALAVYRKALAEVELLAAAGDVPQGEALNIAGRLKARIAAL